jgi:uncharacterized membrane-anchored protein
MLKKLLHVVVAALMMGVFSFTWADAPGGGQPKMTAEQFLASLNFQSGKIDLPGGIAALDLPQNFRYLNPADATRVLVDAWGNPPGGTTLGMIVPADGSLLSQEGWGVIITYQEDGHVNDEDANKINYGDLLKQMKEDTATENEQRVKQGYPSMLLSGWAEDPHYDPSTHKLYWALDLATGDSQEHTLNYNIRVLGRKGVLVLNAVAGMHQLSGIKTEMQNVIAFTEFKPGNGYADFNSNTDKVAEYGIAALVAGGVAAKLGLFAKLFALLVAFKKAIIIGFVALVAAIKKLLGLKKKEEPAPETHE